MTEQATAQPGPATLEPHQVLRRRPSPQVEWVEIEGEVVIWNQAGESLHLLDPVASLIFQLIDGETPLAVTVEDLAGSFGRLPEEISDDICAFASCLVDLGIVEEVR